MEEKINITTPEITIIVVSACLFLMLVGLIAVFYNRTKQKKGIGGRAIQMVTVIFALPSIIILAVLGIFTSDTVAALFGALIGYVLSGLSDFEKEKTKRNKDKSNDGENKN